MRVVSYIQELLKRAIISFYGAITGRVSYLPDDDSLPLIKTDLVRFYADTPNTIIRFEANGTVGYFRECRRHHKPKEFLRELFDDYCRYVYINDNSIDCRKILFCFLDSSTRWKKFYKMGEGTAKFSSITKFRKTGDYRILGFKEGLPDWFYEQLLSLVQFAWGPLMEHRYCSFLHKGFPQTFNSSKSIVTKIVADYYGVGDLVPRTYYAKLEFEGKQRVGVVVESAMGENPDLLGYKLCIKDIDPLLQKNLLSLWVIDQICYQKDHRPGNYFIGKNESCRYSFVSAFDNDCPTTLFPTSSLMFSTYTGIAPMFNKGGICRIPYLSKKIANAVDRLDEEALKNVVKNFCSKLECSMLIHRVRSLRTNILKNVASGRLTLLSDDEWNDDTMQYELRMHDVTYFSYFVRRYVEEDEN